MTYTVKDLDKVIEDRHGEWGGSWDDFLDHIDSGVAVEIPGIGRANLVTRLDGYEGQSEHGFIFSVKDDEGERLFCRNGWFSSYSEEGEYDGPTVEVEPHETTITVYDSV